jgi:hypothetical protein
MPLNTANLELIALRREAVSELRRKRMTQRQIVKALPQYIPPIVGPDGKPFSLGTINSDLKALQREWRKNAEKATADHVADQYESLEALERRCWADGDMAGVARAIALKMKLTGTEAPTKIEIDWREEARRQGYDADQLYADMVNAARARMVEAGGGGSVE